MRKEARNKGKSGENKHMKLWVRVQVIQCKYITEIYNVILNSIIGLCYFNNFLF